MRTPRSARRAVRDRHGDRRRHGASRRHRRSMPTRRGATRHDEGVDSTPPTSDTPLAPRGAGGSVIHELPGPATTSTRRLDPDPRSTASPWPAPPPVAVAVTLQPEGTENEVGPDHWRSTRHPRSPPRCPPCPDCTCARPATPSTVGTRRVTDAVPLPTERRAQVVPGGGPRRRRRRIPTSPWWAQLTPTSGCRRRVVGHRSHVLPHHTNGRRSLSALCDVNVVQAERSPEVCRTRWPATTARSPPSARPPGRRAPTPTGTATRRATNWRPRRCSGPPARISGPPRPRTRPSGDPMGTNRLPGPRCWPPREACAAPTRRCRPVGGRASQNVLLGLVEVAHGEHDRGPRGRRRGRAERGG